MTDYLSEQKDELEVLTSIYPEEIQISSEESPISFSLYQTLDDLPKNQDLDSDDEEEVIPSVILKVTFTETYPEESPEWEVLPSKACGLDKEDIEFLDKELKQIVEDNLGMAMVFALASQLKDSILERIQYKAAIREKEAEAKLEEALKAEEAKFIGTKVTPELFLEWKVKFDAEMEQLESKDKHSFKKEKKKATGRQLFEKDSKLALSDMQFLEEGDKDVDTSQFERLSLGLREIEEEDSTVLNMLRDDKEE